MFIIMSPGYLLLGIILIYLKKFPVRRSVKEAEKINYGAFYFKEPQTLFETGKKFYRQNVNRKPKPYLNTIHKANP